MSELIIFPFKILFLGVFDKLCKEPYHRIRSEAKMKNIPNILSGFRIVLVPIFAFLFLGLNNIPWACGVYILAGVTDIADGFIARKFNYVTKLGIILDPIADKLLQLTVTASLAISGLKFMWIVFGVLLLKEILQLIGGLFLLKKKDVVIPSVWFGKVSSAYLFFAALILIIWHDTIAIEYQFVLIFTCLGFFIFAWIGYMLKFKAIVKKGKKQNETI